MALGEDLLGIGMPREKLLSALIRESETPGLPQFGLDLTVVFEDPPQVVPVFCGDLTADSSDLVDFKVTHQSRVAQGHHPRC